MKSALLNTVCTSTFFHNHFLSYHMSSYVTTPAQYNQHFIYLLIQPLGHVLSLSVVKMSTAAVLQTMSVTAMLVLQESLDLVKVICSVLIIDTLTKFIYILNKSLNVGHSSIP